MRRLWLRLQTLKLNIPPYMVRPCFVAGKHGILEQGVGCIRSYRSAGNPEQGYSSKCPMVHEYSHKDNVCQYFVSVE